MPTEARPNLQPYPMAHHIEMWPIDKLIPFARNPRTHSEAQVDQIAASIVALVSPIQFLSTPMLASSPATAVFLLRGNSGSKRCRSSFSTT